MRKLTVVLASMATLLFFFLAAAAIAGPLEDVGKAIGRGDYKAASSLVRPLAENGLPKAQNLLGFMYQTGQGVGQDYAEAFKWYKKAADQGDAEGQNNVGVMYENGTGVWQDHEEAAKWYWKAAEQGNPVAQNNLGVMYAFGTGVPQDYVFAYLWFDLAFSGFPESNVEAREQARWNRETAVKNMSPEQLEHAQKMVRDLKPKMGL